MWRRFRENSRGGVQMGKIKIIVDPRVTEQVLMEHCLNLASSGFEPIPLLSFYALANSWKIGKLLDYLDLIAEVRLGGEENDILPHHK